MTEARRHRIRQADQFEWTLDNQERLRVLWTDLSISTRKIAEELGTTHSSVTGKAHRMKLVGRSSPIMRAANGPKQSPQPQRIKGPTLPDVISAQRIAQIAAITDTAIDTSDIPEADAAFFARAKPGGKWSLGPKSSAWTPPKPSTTTAPTPQPARECSWITGDALDRKNRAYCNAPALQGKPYCQEHCNLAYIKVEKKTGHA